MRLPSFRAALLTSASVVAALAALDCSQQPISVPVRSLEQSGRVAFMCTTADDTNPPDKKNYGAWIDTCATYYPHTPGVAWNHLLALVTQPIRGEIALVDLSAGSVVDMDPSKPGYNFVPTGANPIDVVTTPGGTAAFVSSAAAGRESIWVIPTRTLFKGPSQLTSFAACALRSAPGEMKVLLQPGTAAPGDQGRGDLSLETQPPGVRKLLVSLPDEGALAVLDAQELLDREPGSFDACDIEPVPLQVQLPPSWPEQVWPQPDIAAERATCWATQPSNVSTSSGYAPRPSAFALDDETSTLYVSDEAAPVIHVLDVSDPGNIVEREPLLPRSVLRPERVVTTRAIAVSPTTSDGKKFVYAVDLREGSVMAFDVSVGSTERTPLIRKSAKLYPFTPPDRISLSVPVQSVSFALRDSPIADPVTGVAQVGVKCDPTTDGIGKGYRTSADFTSGAGPRNLRGIFGFLALTNGQIVVVDVDDFDAPCRRPKITGLPGGCEGDEPSASYEGADGEISCDIVARHEMRSATFFSTDEAAGARVPALQSYPVLTLDNAVLPTDQTDEGKLHPKMLAPKLDNATLLIGGRPVDTVESNPTSSEQNMILFDYREPRVHFEQGWAATYEGAVPGFSGHVGRFEESSDANGRTTFWDGGAFFCDRGVHDLDAARAVGTKRGVTDPAGWGNSHVDVLEIVSDFLVADDPYWTAPVGECSLLQCREAFGLVETPKPKRDFPIVESYQDHVVVTGVDAFTRCCFQFLPAYTVRATGQWVVTGSSSGFLHGVVPDPTTRRCVDSCDPTRELYNGRAYELNPVATKADPVVDPTPNFDDPKAFRNPLMQFVIWKGTHPSERDMTFSISTINGFAPLLVNLASSSSYVQPQSMQLVPQIGQLAVADGAAQGLVLVDLSTLAVSATYF